MIRQLRGLMLTGLGFLLLPLSGQAQVTRYQDRDCVLYVVTDPPRERQTADLVSVTRCLAATATRAEAVLQRLQSGFGPTDTVRVMVGSETIAIGAGGVNGFLINEHSAYKRLRRWVPALTVETPDRAAALAADLAVREARDLLHDGLALRDLNQVFSAALISGAVNTSGNQFEGDNSQDGLKAGAHLVWESKHFRPNEEGTGNFDFSLRGRFGLIPTLDLVAEAPETDTETTAPVTETIYQTAMVWDMALRLNYQIQARASSEVTGVFRIGQAILGDRTVLVDRGASSTLAHPLSNGTGSAAWFYEGGLEFSIYNTQIEAVHAEGSAVSPAFTVGLFYRHDKRFRPEGDLASFYNPQRRGVFRFMIDALRVLDKRELGSDPKVFTLGFGIEHEFAVSGKTTVPSGTQLMLRGDIDLLRALQGGRE